MTVVLVSVYAFVLLTIFLVARARRKNRNNKVSQQQSSKSPTIAHVLVENCLKKAKDKNNKTPRKPLPRGLSPREILSENSKRGRQFEKQVEEKLIEKLGHIEGLDINPQLTFESKDRCDFLLAWKDFYGRVRVVILECKHSDALAFRAKSRIRKAAEQLLRYKEFIQENVNWKIDLLVVLTDFPLYGPTPAYFETCALALNANSMLDVFIEEFISLHTHTLTAYRDTTISLDNSC